MIRKSNEILYRMENLFDIKSKNNQLELPMSLQQSYLSNTYVNSINTFFKLHMFTKHTFCVEITKKTKFLISVQMEHCAQDFLLNQEIMHKVNLTQSIHPSSVRTMC